MGGRTLTRSVALLAVLGSILISPTAQAATPQSVFATDSSGMVKITADCAKNAHQYGSGFLLGPKLLMTARHVLVDEFTGKSCRGSVVQDGTRKSARVVRWMAIGATNGDEPTDLAIAVLSNPLTGYNFSLSTASPKKGKLVLALGYGLTQPLSLNQGHVRTLIVHDHVRLIEMNLAEEAGASGGPILNAAGNVVAVVQVGTGSRQVSVDLPHLVGDEPTQFCFGVAQGQASTICPRAWTGTPLLAPDASPAICAGFAIDLPFEDCPAFADDVTGVVHLKAQCPKTGAISGSGFLLGPRLVMTARSLLIDPSTAANCVVTAQQFTGKSAKIERWMGIRVAGPGEPTDLALAVLASPLQGYHFTISSTSPKPGEAVHVLNYSVGLPRAQNETHVTKLPIQNDLRQLKMNIKLVADDWGGPIVNAQNEVVGVTQWGSTTVADALSVDLADITQGDPTQLCFGDALGQVATICPALQQTSVPAFERDTTPEICGSTASVPPFSVCQSAGASATPSISACWVSTTSTGDSSTKVDQITDLYPSLYFHVQLDGPGTAATTHSVTLTSPGGTVSNLVTNVSIGPLGSTFSLGPLSWNHGASGHIVDGTWTYNVTLSSGGSCSASFAAVHQ